MDWRDKANYELLREYTHGLYIVREYANRLAISRIDKNRLTWEELQSEKQLLLGDTICIEVFPASDDVVNLRHTRHLWFSDTITECVKSECVHAEFKSDIDQSR